MSEPPALSIEQVSFRYPGAAAPALRDVSVRIAPGSRVGLLGQNGAGKSTLMRLCCGFLPLHRGRITVAGHDVRRGPAARRAVGYQPETVPLYPELRVREYLSFRAALKGVGGRGREVARVAELTGLSHQLLTPIARLSRGYRQRVGIADALLGSPPLLVLDEPTVGLDPTQVQEVRALLREVEQTLVFSSHILSEVAALCQRVIVLHGGAVVADEAVGQDGQGPQVEVEVEADPDRVRSVVQACGLPVRSLAARGDTTTARVDGGSDVSVTRRVLGRALAEAGLAVHRLETRGPDLEARFAALTAVDDGGQQP